MTNLIELTAEIVAAHASNNQLSSEQLVAELASVHAVLKALEQGVVVEAAEPAKPALTVKQAFKKDEVLCMICGKGFTTLKRHLAMAHNLKPGEYRKQFGIPARQSLTAKSYSESRRQMALDKGLGEGLAKARAIRAGKSLPAVKAKAAMPTKKEKALVSAVQKAALPAKTTKAKPVTGKKK